MSSEIMAWISEAEWMPIESALQVHGTDHVQHACDIVMSPYENGVSEGTVYGASTQ